LNPTEPSDESSPDGLDDLLCKPVEPDVELLDAPHGEDDIP